MENRRQETGHWKLVNWPAFHLRFSLPCFHSFLFGSRRLTLELGRVRDALEPEIGTPPCLVRTSATCYKETRQEAHRER